MSRVDYYFKVQYKKMEHNTESFHQSNYVNLLKAGQVLERQR